MTEPKFKLGDDGELEEVFDDFEEKPKRKQKPKFYPRTLHIPLSLMLLLSISIVVLVLVIFELNRAPQLVPNGVAVSQYSSPPPRPTETPGGYLDKVPPCGMLPNTLNQRFVFRVGPSGTDTELLRIDGDGGNSCRLTNNETYDDQPAWSPDGTKIAFRSSYYATGYNNDDSLYIIDANGSNLFKVTTGFNNLTAPDWSPDGKRIVFSGTPKGGTNPDIFAIDVDGSNLVNLTNHPRVDSSPKWSPDGQSIAFASDRTYQEGVAGAASQPKSYEIYVMDSNGENVRQLTMDRFLDVSPAWSPDGQRIAFQKETSIYTMDKFGKNLRRLTERDISATTPFWMPDGTAVGYSIDRNAIQLINITSGQIRSVRVPGNPDFVAVWSPPEKSS